jgi:hypothetical protein
MTRVSTFVYCRLIKSIGQKEESLLGLNQVVNSFIDTLGKGAFYHFL